MKNFYKTVNLQTISDTRNLAYRKRTSLSSISHIGSIKKAVDLATYASVTQTLRDEVSWWVVNLESEYIITAVQITNIHGDKSACKYLITFQIIDIKTAFH